MTAFLIVLPLGIVAIIAGLVVGNTNISLASSHGVYCGSAFGGGSGTLNPYVEEACAPLLSEHQLWATILLVLGAGLLISSVVLYRVNAHSIDAILRQVLPTVLRPGPLPPLPGAAKPTDPLPPPPGTAKRGWYPDPTGTGKQRYWNGKVWSDPRLDGPEDAREWLNRVQKPQ
ncbi:DUF2510 domain-containing protein [Mycobacterium colombiense]